MKKQYYEALDETLYSEILPNGLRILVCKRPGFSKKICYFATDFGSVHTSFTFEGKHYTVPAGVAHFLEHKLFDLPGRDVTAEFSAMGASVNAFTSYDLTAYYFSCTQEFDACLKLLLEFVSMPYFTAQTVAKEMPIIGQEIDMSADEPGGRAFEQMLASLYARHPIRQPILGTRETIAQITPEILTLCHRAFYNPANMYLCVVGDVEPEQVSAIARQLLGDEKRPMGCKDPWPEEKMTAFQSRTTDEMEVAMPLFSMAFKAQCPEKGESAIRREFVGDLAAEALFGESSALYMQLYEQGRIDSSFGGGFEATDGCAYLTCGGDSDEAEAVAAAILEQGRALAQSGIPQEDFLRMKRSAMGRRIRDLDSFDGTCFRLCAYAMSEFDYFTFPALYDRIEKEEVRLFLEQVVRSEGVTLSIINPIEEEKP